MLFRGEPFGVDGPVAVVVTYGLCATTAAYQALVETFGMSQLALLADFARELRMAGYELLITGDLNGYTKSAVGFGGDSAFFGECSFPEEMMRQIDCKHQRFNSNGHDVLAVCEQAELVILNGLQIHERENLFASPAVTREEASSVIDYFLISSGLLPPARVLLVV